MPYKNNMVVIAFASLLCYAAAVVMLGQQRYSQYNVEQFIVASALSHAEYETPIGAVYQSILDPLAYHPSNIQTTIKQLLENKREGDALGPLWTTLPDSLGIVHVAIVSMVFKLFGVTLAAFPAIAIGVSTLTVLGFMARFQDGRLFAAPLHFFILTILLLGPISVEDAVRGQVNEFPIGGIRYFELLAVLPAIHLLLEILDDDQQRLSRLAMIGTLCQVVMLALCIFARSASFYLVLAMFTLTALRLRAKVPGFIRQRLIAKMGGFVVCFVLVAGVVYALAPSDYRKEGRVTGALWHRLLVSLGTNPAWPFGDLKARYNLCVEPYTAPLTSGVQDGTGGCIWTQYVRSNGLPDGELVRGFYDNRYEREVRLAFFNVVAEFPSDVAKTFLYYKPAVIITALKAFIGYQFDFSPANHPAICVCCTIQLLLLFAAAHWQRAFLFRQGVGVAAVFLLFSLIPLQLAWANIHTIVDLVYWCFATFVMLVLAVLEWIRRPALQ